MYFFGPGNNIGTTTVCAHNVLNLNLESTDIVMYSIYITNSCLVRDLAVRPVNSRHERIHTKKGSHMKTQTDPDEVDDLATLEVLDEVRKSKTQLWPF